MKNEGKKRIMEVSIIIITHLFPLGVVPVRNTKLFLGIIL